MTDVLQISFPFLVPFSILVPMSLLSLGFFVIFHLKKREMSRRRSRISISVFDKTFSIFDPSTEHKPVFHNISLSLILISSGGVLAFSLFIAIGVLEAGLLLSLFVFTICINLTMIEEAFDIHKNVGIFIKAIDSGVGFGKGDVSVFLVMSNALPRLGLYYLSLTGVFLFASLTLPFIVSSTTLFITQLFGLTLGVAAAIGPYVYWLTPLPIVLLFLAFQIVFGKVRSRILNSPFSDSSKVFEESAENLKTLTKAVAHHEAMGFRPTTDPEEILKNEQKKKE